MKMRPTPSALLALLLVAAPATAGDLSVGPFAPGETIAPFAAASPRADSRTFVKTVAVDSGRAVVDLPALTLATGEALLVRLESAR